MREIFFPGPERTSVMPQEAKTPRAETTHAVTESRACPSCRSAMRLVGIEADPSSKCRADLITYECACGQILVERSERDA